MFHLSPKLNHVVWCIINFIVLPSKSNMKIYISVPLNFILLCV
uniref:Uncharacterized protein n=1 Tax=Rhizophora mucronata TaxID=61149 RepID=A0A2P2NNW6_RHIMU